MQHANQIIQALAEIKTEIEEEFKNKCLKAIEYKVNVTSVKWPEGLSFKFSNPKWGHEGKTELCIVMDNNGKFIFRAYDIPDGKIKNLIDSDTSYSDIEWGGKSFITCLIKEDINKEEALLILKNITSQLQI